MPSNQKSVLGMMRSIHNSHMCCFCLSLMMPTHNFSTLSHFQRIIGPTIHAIEQNILKGCEEEIDSKCPEEKASDAPTNAESLDNPSLEGMTTDTDRLLFEAEELLRRLESNSLYPEILQTPAQETLASSPVCVADDPALCEPKLDESIELLFRKASSNWGVSPPPAASSLVIFIQLILPTIQHVQHPSSKLVALQLLLRLGKLTSDEVRLQRIVPVVTSILNDTNSVVRALSIVVLSDTLSAIKTFPPSDAQVRFIETFKNVEHVSDVVIFTWHVCLLFQSGLSHFFHRSGLFFADLPSVHIQATK